MKESSGGEFLFFFWVKNFLWPVMPLISPGLS